MKTFEKMKHVRRFDSIDAKKLSAAAFDIYSNSDMSIFVRGMHSYEWIGSNCVEDFTDLYEVHSNNSIYSDLLFETDSLDDLSGFFEGLLIL